MAKSSNTETVTTLRGKAAGLDGGGAIFGTEGWDDLIGTAKDDWIYGLGGNDFIAGDAGNDVLNGGGGADSLFGGDGHDLMLGDDPAAKPSKEGADHLSGGAGDDILYGGSGDDMLSGGTGTDFLDGGDHNDIIYVGYGHFAHGEVYSGGDGVDQLRVSGGDLGLVTIDIAAGTVTSENGMQARFSGIERADGFDGSFSITGSGGQSAYLEGSQASDVLAASIGRAWLRGEEGDDKLDFQGVAGTLAGDAGNDEMRVANLPGSAEDFLVRVEGGTGADILGIDMVATGGEVVWADFSQADDDKIDVGGSGDWTSYEEMIKAGVAITQVGSDTLIQYDDTTIRLQGFTGTLGEDDFIF